MSTTLVVTGCALFAAALFAPVMRWSKSPAHATAGDARIWYGDGWTLADGGFEGAALLPVASAAAGVLAVLVLVARGRMWRLKVTAAMIAGYVPVWTAFAFARKWEDDVDPHIAAAFLVAATLLTGLGLWLGRPGLMSSTLPPDTEHAGVAGSATDLS